MKTEAEFKALYPRLSYKKYVRGFHIPDKAYGPWKEKK